MDRTADGRSFRMLTIFGASLKTGQAIGTSDELGMVPVEDAISIPDFHATIHAARGHGPRRKELRGHVHNCEW